MNNFSLTTICLTLFFKINQLDWNPNLIFLIILKLVLTSHLPKKTISIKKIFRDVHSNLKLTLLESTH